MSQNSLERGELSERVMVEDPLPEMKADRWESFCRNETESASEVESLRRCVVCHAVLMSVSIRLFFETL